MFADVPRPSERTGLPSWAVPLYCSVLCASTTLPQTRVTHAVILPVLLLFAYHGLSYTTGKAGDDYALGTHLIMQIYAYGELTLLSPLASTRRKDRGGLWTAPVPPGTSFGQASWLQRARMSLALWPSMRRIGWNVELDKSRPIKQVGGEQALSRWQSTFRHLARAIAYLFWMDLLLYLRYDLFGTLRNRPENSPPNNYPFWANAYAVTILTWFYFRALLEFYVSFFAAFTLPTYLCIPEDYPEVSEAWTESYTVRNLWGRSWHQFCRTFNQIHSRALCDLLHIPKGSLSSRYTQMFVAFAMTTLSHWMGALMMSGMLHGEFGFIMMQPVAIMLEDGILAVGKRLGIKMNWAWRVLGYVWVASFIVWSGWQWFDAMELEDTWMWHALRPNLAKKAVERFLA